MRIQTLFPIFYLFFYIFLCLLVSFSQLRCNCHKLNDGVNLNLQLKRIGFNKKAGHPPQAPHQTKRQFRIHPLFITKLSFSIRCVCAHPDSLFNINVFIKLKSHQKFENRSIILYIETIVTVVELTGCLAKKSIFHKNTEFRKSLSSSFHRGYWEKHKQNDNCKYSVPQLANLPIKRIQQNLLPSISFM